MASGICYTQSGSTKKYEQDLFTISPDRVKLVDFDNHYAKPFIPYMYTPSRPPSGVSLEEGTVMYVVDLKDPDIDLKNYLTYTPPDGYELVSEDHQYDTGVKKYYVSKDFYCEPFTVYYGTAGKTFSESVGVGKSFYYKKKLNIDYPVTISINGTTVHCSCDGVTGIPGTNNGNVMLRVHVGFRNNTNGSTRSIYFEWIMGNGINDTKSVIMDNATYQGSIFISKNSWQVTDSDGDIINYTFVLNVI